MMEILHLLPRVPPAVCGVGDYAWNLAGQLQKGHGIGSSYLTADPHSPAARSEAPFKVSRLDSRSTKALVGFLAAPDFRRDAIVLHYSGYGFAPRGAPWWLARALAIVRQLPARPMIVTMFHELHAAGSIRSSSFWLQPLQKAVVQRIARASDFIRTNREDYASRLRHSLGASHAGVTVMPVFSNLGESPAPLALTERAPQMVVFSTGLQDASRVREVQRAVADLCKKFGLVRAHLVGRHWEASAMQGGIEMRRHDFISVSEAAGLLQDCRMGYVVYPSDYLGKSTWFAAMAAHGLAVITEGSGNTLPDGLQEGREILHRESAGPVPGISQLQEIAGHLHAWYQPHNLSRTAASYARDLAGASQAGAR